MSDSENIFYHVSALAVAVGAAPVNQFEGCWEYAVDERWQFALNGHREPREAFGLTVPPFSLYVEFNGWAAGVLNPQGGEFAAGDIANTATFLAALQGAIARETQNAKAEGR